MENAFQNGYIEKQSMNISNIQEQQPYQWERRKLEGWRLLPVLFVTRGLVTFKALSIWSQFLKANFKKGIKNSVGTYKRINQLNGK